MVSIRASEVTEYSTTETLTLTLEFESSSWELDCFALGAGVLVLLRLAARLRPGQGHDGEDSRDRGDDAGSTADHFVRHHTLPNVVVSRELPVLTGRTWRRSHAPLLTRLVARE